VTILAGAVLAMLGAGCGGGSGGPEAIARLRARRAVGRRSPTSCEPHRWRTSRSATSRWVIESSIRCQRRLPGTQRRQAMRVRRVGPAVL